MRSAEVKIKAKGRRGTSPMPCWRRGFRAQQVLMHKYFSLCFLWSEGVVTPQTWGHSSSFKHPQCCCGIKMVFDEAKSEMVVARNLFCAGCAAQSNVECGESSLCLAGLDCGACAKALSYNISSVISEIFFSHHIWM